MSLRRARARIAIGAIALCVLAACAPSAGIARGEAEPSPTSVTAPPVGPTPGPNDTLVPGPTGRDDAPGPPGPDRNPPSPGGPGSTPGSPAEPDPPKGSSPRKRSACTSPSGKGGIGSKVSDRTGAGPTTDRPVVRLCFDVPADRTPISGHETVTFAPDRRTCQLVFRAWPNKPGTARGGSGLRVDRALLDGKAVQPVVEAAGALPGAPGTLIRLPVPDCLAKGSAVTVDLDFTLALGRDVAERVGYDPAADVAWFGTAYPLLAWEPGRGWATEPAVDLLGESVTSATFRLDSLLVISPSVDRVLATGHRQPTAPGPEAGTTIHRFTAQHVRDVAVSVGALQIVNRDVAGTRIHVGAPVSGTRYPVGRWADAVEGELTHLTSYLGRFPYDDLSVTIAPSVPTGIEFPAAIQLADTTPQWSPHLISHELAHMWFYGLVGNDQARDPWMDEAFAEYAEALVDGVAARYLDYRPPARVRDQVGRSMRWYARLGTQAAYGEGVYRQGAAMLLRARRAVGAGTWDQLLREYLRDNAHTIATPADVARALRGHPRALAILRHAGALPE